MVTKAFQKGGFYNAKRGFLACKKGVFIMQKGGFCKVKTYLLFFGRVSFTIYAP